MSSSSARPHAVLAGLGSSDAARALLPRALRLWLEAEESGGNHRVDRRRLDPGSQAAVPELFRPRARATHLLESAWLPVSQAHLLRAGPLESGLEGTLLRTRGGRREVLFLWHPLAWGHAAKALRGALPGPRFFAAATASLRTLLVWPTGTGTPFFAKLSLPLEVGGELRTIGLHQATASTDASRLLDALRAQAPLRLQHLREPLAVVPRAAPHCGFIVREVPVGVLRGTERWVPFFALLAPPVERSGGRAPSAPGPSGFVGAGGGQGGRAPSGQGPSGFEGAGGSQGGRAPSAPVPSGFAGAAGSQGGRAPSGQGPSGFEGAGGSQGGRAPFAPGPSDFAGAGGGQGGRAAGHTRGEGADARSRASAGVEGRSGPLGFARPRTALGRAQLEATFRRTLVEPLVAAWLEAAVSGGFTAELHAQNLLVEVEPEGRPTGRFALRDLESVSADLPFLARAHPALSPTVEALLTARSSVGDEPDEALRTSLHQFLLGGPGYGLGLLLGTPRRGRGLFLAALERLLDAPAPTRRGPAGRALRSGGPQDSSPRREAAALAGAARAGAPLDVRDAEAVREELSARRAARVPPPPLPDFAQRFLAREQGPNARDRDRRFFAPVALGALPVRFDPARALAFPLDCLELPASEVTVLRSQNLPGVLQRALFTPEGRARLFVHPFMRERLGLLVARHGLRPTEYWASPTSSPRSLVVWSARGDVFGLKVSLDVELLGLSRLIHASKLRRALAVDACFEAISAAERRRLGFLALREPLALLVKERGDGQLARVLPPAVGAAVPGFGLFAPGGLLDAVPRAQLPEVLARQVFAPLARVAAGLMFGQGLLGQLHQQNVLFGLDAHGALDGTLVLKDLDGFRPDPALRRARGLSNRPFTAQPEARAALASAEGEARYDEAWGKHVRADFGHLADGLLRRRGIISVAERRRAVWSALDRAFLCEAAANLGEPFVRQELRFVLARRRGARAARAWLEGAGAGAPLAAVLERLDGALWSAPEDCKVPLYSVNALAHALKASLR